MPIEVPENLVFWATVLGDLITKGKCTVPGYISEISIQYRMKPRIFYYPIRPMLKNSKNIQIHS